VLGFSHTPTAGKTVPMRGLADLRWIAGIDERVLWATLAAALLMALWGAFIGWRRRGS
jgi:hypothetical protein